MSLAVRLQELAVRVATEAKSLRTLINGNAGTLAALNTTAKSNLVAAINELKAAVDAAASSGGAAIDDGATTTATVWSSTKTASEIDAAVTGLLDGAPGALDTLNELAAALGDDASFSATITAALANRVRVDAAQGLTSPQQVQARANIDAASAAAVGDTEQNLVTVFEAALV